MLEAKRGRNNKIIAALLQEHLQPQSEWEPLKRRWVPRDVRNQVVDDVDRQLTWIMTANTS